MTQPKHTLLLRCVVPFFSTYLSNRIIVQGVQGSYDGYGAQFPAAEAFPGVRPYPAPPADMPPPAHGLRDLVGRLLNNPGTLVNMLRIVPGPDGRFEVWIALELADIYIF